MRTLLIALSLAAAAILNTASGADAPATPALAMTSASHSPQSAAADTANAYRVQPGDLLQVTVWKEQDLTGDVLVRPDGGLSFPLVGDLTATGKTCDELRQEISERLKRFIPSPVVTVATKQIGGNHVYVVGKVQRPGEYPFARPLDVMQALSLAGGTTPYAAVNDIVILHRENGAERAIRFHYSAVAHGKDLAENIVLQSGDTVVVP
jgi:polysaccharide export outer membrane protein